MALLLYAVTECGHRAPDLDGGVAGAAITTKEIANLRCFYSETTESSRARDAALEFHRVVQAILSAEDLIPFRFPTFLSDEAELALQIQEHAAEYHTWLERVRGRVQMEIRIARRDQASEPALGDQRPITGAEYLRSRQGRQAAMQGAAAVFEKMAQEMLQGWRRRESSDHIRCFALIARDGVGDFQNAVEKADIPPDLIARVSGPWPATEFFNRDSP
jgi:hypothetical protein